MRLQGARFTVLCFREIEEHNMCVQLRCRVPVHGPRAVMLEAGCNPFARRFCRMVAADPRLDILFHFVKRNLHAFSMRLAHTFVSAHERSQRHALRCGERRIPACTVLHRAHRFAALVHVFARGLVAHQLFARQRMLPVGEALEVLLLHFTVQAPLCGEFAVPLAAYPVALGVVVLLGVGELFFVIRLRLAGTQRFGDGQHDSLEVRFLSGGDAFEFSGSRGLISCAAGALG